MTVAEPKLGTNYSEMPPADARSGDEGTTDDGDTPTDGSGDGGIDRAEVETDAVLPLPMDLDGSSKMFGQCVVGLIRKGTTRTYSMVTTAGYLA